MAVQHVDTGGTSTGTGMGMMVGLMLVLVVLLLFFFLGTGRFFGGRSTAPSISVPDQIDVNVDTPQQ